MNIQKTHVLRQLLAAAVAMLITAATLVTIDSAVTKALTTATATTIDHAADGNA